MISPDNNEREKIKTIIKIHFYLLSSAAIQCKGDLLTFIVLEIEIEFLLASRKHFLVRIFRIFSRDPPVHNRAQCSNHENGPINYKIGEEENLKPIKFPSIVLVTFLILIAFQEAVLRGAPSVTVHHKVHFIK